MELHFKTQFYLKPSRKSVIKNQFSNSISIRRNTLNLRNIPFAQSYEAFTELIGTLVSAEEKALDTTGEKKLSIVYVQYCDDESEWISIDNQSDWAELLIIHQKMMTKSTSTRFTLKVRVLLALLGDKKDIKGKNVKNDVEQENEECSGKKSNENSSSSSTPNMFQMFSNMFNAKGGCQQSTNNPFMNNLFGFPHGGGNCGFNNGGSNMFKSFGEFNPEKHAEMIGKFATKENVEKAKNWWEENKEKVINIADQFVPKNTQNSEEQSSSTCGTKNMIDPLVNNLFESFANFTDKNQTTGSSSQTQPESETTIEEDLKKFQSELVELYSLGFTNEALNIKFLKKWGGNLTRVVDSLLQHSE